jgi:hypothetical protein
MLKYFYAATKLLIASKSKQANLMGSDQFTKNRLRIVFVPVVLLTSKKKANGLFSV